MRTVGIDLAVQARTTAACVIDWESAGAHVLPPRLGCGDAELLELLVEVDFHIKLSA